MGMLNRAGKPTVGRAGGIVTSTW